MATSENKPLIANMPGQSPSHPVQDGGYFLGILFVSSFMLHFIVACGIVPDAFKLYCLPMVAIGPLAAIIGLFLFAPAVLVIYPFYLAQLVVTFLLVRRYRHQPTKRNIILASIAVGLWMTPNLLILFFMRQTGAFG